MPPRLALILLCSAVLGTVPRLGAVDFQREVRPILSDKCFACHGPDEHDRKAGLRLDTAEGALADLGGYAAIVPGDLAGSEMWHRMRSDERDEIMPPSKAHKPLSDHEIDILEQWIREGATYEEHWAYEALELPPLPEGTAAHPVDRLIRARLDVAGIEPSAEADRRTLARRIHLDLLGLPPRPEMVEAFAADPAPDAWEKLVRGLLDAPAFGERFAVFWLDLVRYADTIGYHSDTAMEVSAYRDWVIDAFNTGMPFDRFTIEQLAGDLLPDATTSQRIASGYNRLLQTTEEGGAQAGEYLAIYAADRVRNVSQAWLGSTVGCAQCHDHKYDPFTIGDFYSLAAFFDDIKEKPLGRREPNLTLPTPAEAARLAELERQLAEHAVERVLQREDALRAALEQGRSRWEAGVKERLAGGEQLWSVAQPREMRSAGGQEMKLLPDGSILVQGKSNPAKDDYTVTVPVSGPGRFVRLEALTDPSHQDGSLSRGNGNFVLTDFQIRAGGRPLPIDQARADYEQPGYPVAEAIDGDGEGTGWAGNGQAEAVRRTAVFRLAETLDPGATEDVEIVLRHRSRHAQHHLGRFRLSLSASEEAPLEGGLDLPLEVLEALRREAGERTEEERVRIVSYYEGLAPELEPHRRQIAAWEGEMASIRKGLRTMLVSESLDEPRVTRILPRGNWMDQSGPVVMPAVPEFLRGEAAPEGRATRLDLAHWIVAPENPLTARAFVNRVWKLMLGRGLSGNVEDLGGQGEPPVHPELLDWLAATFRDTGWEVKELVYLIATSETYRQASTVRPGLAAADPGNELVTRQSRWRIEAEFVRDTALRVSGLLVEERGGTSVKPYQPAGYWQHLNFPKREWETGQGNDLYRRGLYTFRCRTFLHPSMLAFDAPSREECTAERARSNIPQQALVLLNDPSFVEAARAFAGRISERPGEVEDRVRWALREALAREATAGEVAVLSDLFAGQYEHYMGDESAAGELTSIGAAPVLGTGDRAALAAWTQVSRAILNLYETTSRF